MKFSKKSSRRNFIIGSAAGIVVLSIEKNLNYIETVQNKFKNKKGDIKKMAYEWKFNKRP